MLKLVGDIRDEGKVNIILSSILPPARYV